jgi:ankyrin repeat protein
LRVVAFLAQRGVDCQRGKNGITPFHMACYRGHLDVVAFLAVERGLDARAIDGHGRTPLEVARRAQRDDVVQFLEQQDPELAKTRRGRESCLATTFDSESAPCSELSCILA